MTTEEAIETLGLLKIFDAPGLTESVGAVSVGWWQNEGERDNG